MYYTAAQKLDIINEYFMSNLSVFRFSEIKGLGKSTLNRWLEQYRKSNEQSFDKESYIPILSQVKEETTSKLKHVNNNKIIVQEETANTSSIKKEITLTSNSFTLKFDISNLKEVLEVLK